MTSIVERTQIAQSNKRNIKEALEEINTLATMDDEIALSCFYVMVDDKKPFVGISVRLAEIIASSWGNIHSGARVMKKSDKEITIQGFVHDFEKNSIFTTEVQRPIFGMTSEKVIQVTNAASSIAFRNAVFKAIPASLTQSIVKNLKRFVNDMSEEKYEELIHFYKKNGVTYSEINEILNKPSSYDIDNFRISDDEVFILVGIKNAIQEGDITIQEVFNKKIASKKPSKYHFEPSDIIEEQKPIKVNLKSSIANIKSEEPVKEDKKEVISEEKPKPKRKRGRPKKVE
jgi:hypothetical protein